MNGISNASGGGASLFAGTGTAAGTSQTGPTSPGGMAVAYGAGASLSAATGTALGTSQTGTNSPGIDGIAFASGAGASLVASTGVAFGTSRIGSGIIVGAGTISGESTGISFSVNALTIWLPYAIGTTWYVVKEAKKGILEEIVIMKYHVIANRATFGKIKVVYIDTMNGVWNRCDLCDRNQAVEFAITYYENELPSYI